MTVSLCIRQGSKRNDDSVSVEELDWSAERQVLIPAEHLWCDFKYRPWAKKCIAKHQWHMGTVISYTSKGGNTIFKYMNYVSIFVASLEVSFSLLKKEVSQYFCPYDECTSHWCLVMSFWLKVCFQSHRSVINALTLTTLIYIYIYIYIYKYCEILLQFQ